jgi:hypothetical protein
MASRAVEQLENRYSSNSRYQERKMSQINYNRLLYEDLSANDAWKTEVPQMVLAILTHHVSKVSGLPLPRLSDKPYVIENAWMDTMVAFGKTSLATQEHCFKLSVNFLKENDLPEGTAEAIWTFWRAT